MFKKSISVTHVAALNGHKDSIYALTGDDAQFIYSSGGDGMVVQWDLAEPKDGVLLAKVDSSVYALGYGFDGLLVVGNNYNGINVVKIATKEMLFSIPMPSCGLIFDILIHLDFIYVATQSGYLYQVNLWARNVEKLFVSTKSLRSIKKTDSGFLVSDSLGKVYFLNDHLEIVHTVNEAEKSVFSTLIIDYELLTVSRDCHLRRYKGLEMIQDQVAHMYAINDISLHPENLFFATASQDKTIKLWDTKSTKLLKVIDATRHNGHLNSVNKLFWSRYNNLLVSCSDDRSIKIWSLEIEEIQ